MKGQLSLEFLIITFILMAYLSTVFILFSSAKSSLTQAVDEKSVNQISKWIKFINQRPEGTEIQIEFKPFPGRSIQILCDKITNINSISENLKIKITTSCTPFNVSEKTCLSFEKIEEGVGIEIC